MFPPADLQRSCVEGNLSRHSSSPPKWATWLNYSWSWLQVSCWEETRRHPQLDGGGVFGAKLVTSFSKRPEALTATKEEEWKWLPLNALLERIKAQAPWATRRERVRGCQGSKTLLICSHTCYPLHHWSRGATSIDYWFHLKSVWRAFKYTFIFF